MSPYEDPQTAFEMEEAMIAADLETPHLFIKWEGDRAPFAKAFVAAQKATEAVKKASSNPAFRSKYADLAGVVEAVVPALNGAGIGVMQFPSFDGEWVMVTTTFLHETGSSVTGELKLRPSKNDPQGVGSAITYGRRYTLLAMSGAAPEDDDGNAASGPREQSQQEHRPAAKRAPTLAERADKFEASLLASKLESDLRKTFELGAGLCGDLDAKDPDRLAEITAVYEQRLAALAGVEVFS